MTQRIFIEQGLSTAIDAAVSAARAETAFLERSWFAAAAPADPWTLVAERDGAVRIALPIGRVHRLLRAVPGCYWPFRSFPVAEAATVADMAALLGDRAARKALGRVWRVGPILADDPALVLLRSAAPETGWLIAERHIATSFQLDLTQPDWPRNSTLRKNRFHEKHLGAHGALDWRFVRGDDWNDALFGDLAAIERKSWHAGSSDPKFLPGPHRGFWEALARDPRQAARMNAAVLYVGGAPAAFSFDIDCDAIKYAIANSYDPALAKHSPGKCLYYRNLIDARARGLTMVDWGAGDGGYKSTIGAVPGPALVDCLVIRAGLTRPLAALAERCWQASIKPAVIPAKAGSYIL